MKNIILSSLLAIACAPALAATLTDPCENAADKIACIEGKIDEQSLLIADRIRYLNETQGPVGLQGPQGETGPQGAPGPQGSKGAAGRDNKTALKTEHDSRYMALLNQDVYVSSLINTPSIKFALLDMENIGAMPRRIADLNRNPDIIGVTPAQRSEADPAWLDFPKDSDGVYLDSFSDTFEKILFVSDIDNEENLRTSLLFDGQPVEEHVDTVAQYCTLRPNSAFCGTDMAGLADLRYMTSIKLEELSELPQELTVQSAREFSIYKLGMEPDDLAFLMVIDHILALFEQVEFKNAVMANMNEALALLDTRLDIESSILQLNIDAAETQELKDQYQQELDTLTSDIAFSRQSLEDGLILFESLSSDEYGLRKERLINYINDSDLLYVTLMNSAIELYWQYKDNPLAMTEEQRAAWSTFEFRFMYFAESFLFKWKDAAQTERDLFFQNYVGSNLDGLLGAPSTPDFVDAGAVRVGDLYLKKQPPAIQTWQTAMASATTVASLAGVTAAGFGLTAGVASAAGSNIVAGSAVYGMFSALTASSSAGGGAAAIGGASGVASAAAAPVAIVVLALTAGIMEGIDVFDQAAKDERYEAFMNYYIHAEDPASLHNIDLPLEDRRNMINNMLYMWMASNSQLATD